MFTIRPGEAIFAGLAATIAMTALMLMGPAMGLRPMNVMLASVMGGSAAIGWAAHLMVGAILALGFGMLFAPRLPGPPLVRGMAYGVVPWLAAQFVVMPMMGARKMK